MPGPDPTEAEVAGLVRRVADAASALIEGDVDRYLSLVVHADDYTLMAPFGGPAVRGFDGSAESRAAMARFFTGPGTAELELVAAHASGDLALLVVIERQRGAVGGLPEQDLSLRVTLAFRREASGWRLLHRHADPLTRRIDLERLAGLARGA